MRPWFVVIDGIEGCGKSTQASMLRDYLKSKGIAAITTKEPGGTRVGKQIRQILLHGKEEMSALTEAFLFCADRAEHVMSEIVPALAAEKWVICDRFSPSTFAYQVWGGDIPEDVYDDLNGVATEPLQSILLAVEQLTIVLDLPAELALARIPEEQRDNFEARPLAYHELVREGFLEWAAMHHTQAVVIDATPESKYVHGAIVGLIEDLAF